MRVLPNTQQSKGRPNEWSAVKCKFEEGHRQPRGLKRASIAVPFTTACWGRDTELGRESCRIGLFADRHDCPETPRNDRGAGRMIMNLGKLRHLLLHVY